MSYIAQQQLQHLHRVKLLFRRTIKIHADWCIDRDHWFCMVSDTRAQFEAMQKLPAESFEPAMQAQERWVKQFVHPDPYVPPAQQGGPVFQRNVPPPYDILDFQRDHGDDH